MAAPQRDVLIAPPPATTGYGGRVAPAPPPPPPPPAPSLTVTAGASSGTTGASITGPTITGAGPGSASWSLSSTPAGLTATPASGTVASGASVTPTLSSATANTYALTVANGSGGTVTGSAGSVTVSAPPPAPDPFAVMSNGVWTWFNYPEAVRVGDNLHVGSISSAGAVQVTQRHLDTAATTTFSLATGFEIDDHNNPSLAELPSGRLAAFFAAHPDTRLRMRVQTTAGDNTAWSTTQELDFGMVDYYYPCPVILSQDTTQQILFFRGRNGSGGYDLCYAISSNFAAGPAVFGSAVRLATNGAQRPYWVMRSNGVDRVDFLMSEGNPSEINGGVWHFYAKLDGSNVLRFYTTNGVEITGSLPHDMTTKFTRVDPTPTDRKHWVWDITIGTDGQPWALWTRFATNAGTDHRQWFSRWNGSAWTGAEIVASGGGLYDPEVYYSPGSGFDRLDPTRIYLGRFISGLTQIERYTVGSGTTVTLVEQITSGTTGVRARPVSPENADSRCRVLWWDGTYTTYTSFSTSIKGRA